MIDDELSGQGQAMDEEVQKEVGIDLAEEMKSIPTTDHAPEEDLPSLQQASLTVCGLFIDELQKANDKYPSFFRSSAEAQGVLLRAYKKAEEALRNVRSCDGLAKDQESLEATLLLKKAFVQLGAMSIKSTISLCDLHADCERFSSVVHQHAMVAEMVQGALKEEDAEAAEL